MLLVRIVETDRLDAFLGQVRLSEVIRIGPAMLEPLKGARNSKKTPT